VTCLTDPVLDQLDAFQLDPGLAASLLPAAAAADLLLGQELEDASQLLVQVALQLVPPEQHPEGSPGS
jgi:hypothetical protein